MWYALYRASGSIMVSATALNGVSKQDIMESKGFQQSDGQVSGRKAGTETFFGICPELTEVCKRKLAAVCAGKKPKDIEFKQEQGSWIAATARFVIEEKIKMHETDPKKYTKPSEKTYKASKLELEIFSSGATLARTGWKISDALLMKNAIGLSKKRKAEAV